MAADLLLIGLIIGLLVALIPLVIYYQFYKRGQWVEEARKDTAKRQRATLKGQITEELAPYLPWWPKQYQASDAHFIGDPIDFIVFDGYTRFKEGTDLEAGIRVVLLDVKRGSSSLTKEQKAIREAVEKGNVAFEEPVRIPNTLSQSVT